MFYKNLECTPDSFSVHTWKTKTKNSHNSIHSSWKRRAESPDVEHLLCLCPAVSSFWAVGAANIGPPSSCVPHWVKHIGEDYILHHPPSLRIETLQASNTLFRIDHKVLPSCGPWAQHCMTPSEQKAHQPGFWSSSFCSWKTPIAVSPPLFWGSSFFKPR